METLIIVLAGVLVMVATYLILSKNVIRVILGIAVLSHAVHLLLMAMGGLKKGNVPLVDGQVTSFTDALPQALILTAIVINFAVTAFFLVLAYRTYQETGEHQFDELRGSKDEECNCITYGNPDFHWDYLNLFPSLYTYSTMGQSWRSCFNRRS